MHFSQDLRVAAVSAACWSATYGFPLPARGDASEANGAHAVEASNSAAASASAEHGDPESDIARARDLFWEAHAAYGRGAYAEAISLFNRSYAVLPQSEVLFNIAIANAKGGHCDEAKRAYSEYAKSAPAGAGESAAKLDSLKAQCADLESYPPPAAETELAPSGPIDAPVQGNATGSTLNDGEPKPDPVEAPLPSARLLDDDTVHAYWTARRIAGWSLVAVAASSVGAVVYFSQEANELNDEVDRVRGSGVRNEGDQLDGLENEMRRAEAGKFIALGTAIGAAAAGVAFLVLAEQDDQRASLSFDSGGGFRLQISGRF